ncbi:MAG: hypothetical protein DI635_00460 [Pseudoxanthomonas suwonensis]|nr:MAG: hypothetical protein DI635_00460 [Pseudoxanthomonas suwonensis]
MKRNSGVWASLAAAALVIGMLGGCKPKAEGQLPAVSGEAIQARRDSIEGFGLVGAYPDEKQSGLALALEFSRPLVGTQDFDRLVTVSGPDSANTSNWKLDDDGKILRMPFVKPNATYTVRIAADLTAADGSKLGNTIEKEVYTGDLDPAVGFASQGSVLPARESRGLPVVSVNVDEVDVEFLRVDEANLPRFFASYQRGGRRGSWALDHWVDKDNPDAEQPISRLGTSVYVNRFVIGGEKNERLVTYLPIQDIEELQDPGLYFAVMRRPGKFQDDYDTAFFTVSDIGLHARAYKDTLFVHTASLKDGSGLSGVELRVLDKRGEAILKAQTDGNGNAIINYTLDAGQVLVARKGRDVSLLPFNQPALDLSEFAVAGREQAWFDVFAWSGRDLYRPGETVQVSALFRDHDGKAVAAKDGKGQSLFVRLKQPDGKTFFETRIEPGVMGYYRFEKQIPVDAPTGSWQVEFRTDPASKEAVQGMRLRIEEFLPERMKLDMDSPDAVVRPGQPLRLRVKGAYLYGAPAAGNRFTAKLSIKAEQHPLPKQLPGYFFGDPTISLPKEAADVIDTTLDENGELEQDIDLPSEARPVSPISAVVAGSLYETGGRTINRSFQRILWPADALVGVRPRFSDEDGADPNSTAAFDIVRVNRDAKPQPVQGLTVTLIRIHHDYHWNYDEDEGWDYDYTERFETVQSRKVDAADQPVRVQFPVEEGGYRLEVTDPATNLVTRYPFHAGWGWDNENRGLDARPDKVKLSLDKTAYRAGDTLEVTVTPPHAGKGLLMVEADRMLYVQEVDVKPGSTFEIPVTKDWERHDVYLTALVFRGGSAPSKITPARAVGVTHVAMERRDRRVAVGLVAPKQMRPETDLPVTVAVPQLAGKEAYVTVSAVDVGILNITRFPVPDANQHFFAQRRLSVDAYDVYGRVIESLEGSIGKLRFGGDMALEPLPQARRPTARVLTVDLFAGPVKLDAKGQAQIRLKVPDFNGTVRVSALVFSADRYGNQSVETVIRAPIVAEASLPRVLAPGDRSTVTLDVTNFTGRDGEFKVQVDGEGPAEVANGNRSISLKRDGKATLSFPLAATEGYSTAKVRVRVDGNGIKVDRRYDLPVRAGWPAVVRTRSLALNPLEPVTLDTAIADGMMRDSVTARLVVSPVPPLPFAAALKGALDYPYGCAEQTASKGYAALVLDRESAQMLGMDKEVDPARRKRVMEGTFGRLASMQASNGHFAMWGGGDDVSAALTPYIAEFLLDARDGGFAVPDAVLQKALQRLNEDLLSGADSLFYGYDERAHLRFAYQAYAGYVLARVGRAPLGTLRSLYDSRRKDAKSGLSLVHLGLALSLQGDKKRGEQAIAQGFALTRPPNLYLGDYGSPLRDEALMIALTHERGMAKPAYDTRVMRMGADIDARRYGSWLYLSTQEQTALARLGKALMARKGKTVSGTLSVGGKDQAIAATRMFGRSFDYAAMASGVRFDPQGEPPMFVSLEAAGVPRSPPAPDDSKLQIIRKLYTVEGKEWTPGPLAEGEALIVALSIKALQDMPDALVTDLLPAGMEIENFNLADPQQWSGVTVEGVDISDRSDAADVKYEEFRDDRYVAAVDLSRHSTARIFYLVRAVTPGTYTVPPPLVEDMYRPDLRGVGKSVPTSITVVQPK